MSCEKERETLRKIGTGPSFGWLFASILTAKEGSLASISMAWIFFCIGVVDLKRNLEFFWMARCSSIARDGLHV